MLKKTALCFASILLSMLFAGTASADPLVITGGFFGGTTTGIDRPWAINISAGANFSLIATGEKFSPSASFLHPGDSLTLRAGAAGGVATPRGRLTIDGVTYTNVFVTPSLQISPTIIIVPDLAPGETVTFTAQFSMTASIDISNNSETFPRYVGQTHFDFVGSGTGTFSLTRGSAGIFLSRASYTFDDASAVPEPATLVLLSTGLAGAFGAARKRRSVKKQS
jgi:PEP-CTERM motif